MTDEDRTVAILDANKIRLYDDNQSMREAFAEISAMLDRFDTFGDADRTRAFVGDLRNILNKASAGTR